MSDARQAMLLALMLLRHHQLGYPPDPEALQGVVDALRAALAQQTEPLPTEPGDKQ